MHWRDRVGWLTLAGAQVVLTWCTSDSGWAVLEQTSLRPFLIRLNPYLAMSALYLPFRWIPWPDVRYEGWLWWFLTTVFALVISWLIVRASDAILGPLLRRIPGHGWTLTAALIAVNVCASLAMGLGLVSNMVLLLFAVEVSALWLVSLPVLASWGWGALRHLAAQSRTQGFVAAWTDHGSGSAGTDGHSAKTITAATSALLVILAWETPFLLTQKPPDPLARPGVAKPLGHGFWKMNVESFNPPGFWEGIYHSSALFWNDVEIGRTEWESISPSGGHLAYQGGWRPEILVFHTKSLSVDTLARGVLASRLDLVWREDRDRVLLKARGGRPEAELRLTATTDGSPTSPRPAR